MLPEARRWLGLTVLLALSCAAWSLSLQDDRGRTVTLARPAERVVSLAPFLTELVYAVGAGDRLVAVSEHSDYPPAARRLPRIGNAFSVKLEALLALRPDLVLSWRTGNDPRVGRRLEAMGIPVFVFEPREIGDIPRALEQIGGLLDAGAAAARRAEEFDRDIESIRQRYAGRAPVRVFYQVARQPLMTLNGQHMFTAVLGLCGGSNVFGEFSPIAPTVNREQVLARDPQAILISSTIPDAAALKDYWRRYVSVTAVRLDNLFLVDSDLINRQTPRLAVGARQLCATLDRARRRLIADGDGG